MNGPNFCKSCQLDNIRQQLEHVGFHDAGTNCLLNEYMNEWIQKEAGLI